MSPRSARQGLRLGTTERHTTKSATQTGSVYATVSRCQAGVKLGTFCGEKVNLVNGSAEELEAKDGCSRPQPVFIWRSSLHDKVIREFDTVRSLFGSGIAEAVHGHF